MNLFKMFLSAMALVMAFSLSGCQGNNSGTTDDITDNNDSNTTNPPIDTNATTAIKYLSVVNGNEISITGSGVTKDIYIMAFNSSGSTNTEGNVTFQYPIDFIINGTNYGIINPGTATVSDGRVYFQYTAPDDLTDLNGTKAEFIFYDATNADVNVSIYFDFNVSGGYVSTDPVLKELIFSDANLTIDTSNQTETLLLQAYSDQSTTDINVTLGVKYPQNILDAKINIGVLPSVIDIVNGVATLQYQGVADIEETIAALNANGISNPIVVNVFDAATSVNTDLNLNFIKDYSGYTLSIVDANRTITAPLQAEVFDIFLKDADGAVSGEIITLDFFDGNKGTVNAFEGVTDANGHVAFNYIAPADTTGLDGTAITFRIKNTTAANNKVSSTFSVDVVNPDDKYKTYELTALPETGFTVVEGSQTQTISLYLEDNASKQPVSGELVNLEFFNASKGTMNLFSTTTDANGHAAFNYTAPADLSDVDNSNFNFVFLLDATSEVNTSVQVDFNSSKVVYTTYALSAYPEGGAVITDAGQSVVIEAYLEDNNSLPVSGENIIVEFFSATYGSMDAYNGVTDADGRVKFDYTAPAEISGNDFNITMKVEKYTALEKSVAIDFNPTYTKIGGLSIADDNVTINKDSQTHTITINAVDENSNFVLDGSIKVVFPSIINTGFDVGTFENFVVTIANGQAKFNYTGPASILDASADNEQVFKFIDVDNENNEVNWTVNFIPDTPTIRMDEANITLTTDTEVVSVKVLAFDKDNQSLDSGTISVAYPNEIVNGGVNGGLFTQTEVAVVNGEAIFTFTGPNNLTSDTSSLDFIFSYKENANVTPTTLTVNYAPLSASIYLNETTKEVTLNSETFTIDVDVRDSNNNPFSTGNVKIVYPDDVKSGRDVGSFISSDIALDASGKASFFYTAPKSLDANESNITFGFYHDSEPTLIKEFMVTIDPEPNQIILTDYKLTNSYADGNLTMDLESTKLLTFYVQDKDDNLLGDSNITSIVVSVLNEELADLDDSNASNPAAETQTIVKNSASLTVISNTISGVVPIKAVATFKGVNNEDITITEVFNVVIVSGPPTAMSINYVSTTNDTENARYVEKMVVAITDKYSNRVNTNPGISVALIAGYAEDSSGPLNYMYHTNGGIIDTTDDKIKVVPGTVMKIDMLSSGFGYRQAPDVTLGGGDGNFVATAQLLTYGGVSSVTLIDAGKNYVTAPTVSAVGSGSGFSGTAVLETTGSFFTIAISNDSDKPIITLDNAGAGYTNDSIPTVTVTTPNGGSGFDATAVLEDTGSLKSINITDAGSGYVVGDELPVGGDGAGAVVKIVTVNATGGITEVAIISAGAGYTGATIDTLTLGNKDARLSATVGYSIKEIQLNNGGSGYDTEGITISGGAPTVNALASAKIGYSINRVDVNNVGSGYRSASIAFSDQGDGSGASAFATIEYPVGGIVITNGGTGYADGAALTITPKAGDNGIGAAATVRVFSDFSTVTENGGINDDFLTTFANDYTYNASGKWDITAVGATNEFERVLKDQYDGTTTQNLGFAIGNNFRQDTCKFGKEWVATAVTPIAEFDSNGLAEIDITYDYYLAAKDVVVSANLVGVQNSIGETVKIGESTKHTLRGSTLVADPLLLPAGLSHAVYRTYVELENTPTGSLRNANFSYTLESTSTGLIIHRTNTSMDDGIENCPVYNDQGRAYIEVEVSTTQASTITFGDLAISREFK